VEATRNPPADVPRPADTPARSRDTTLRVIGYLLLSCWVFLIAASLLTGYRASSFDDLRDDIATGRISDVQVTGGLPAGGTGFSVVEVRWRDGLLGEYTNVVEARPPNTASRRAANDWDATAVLARPVDLVLADVNPDVEVTRQPRADGLNATTTVLSFVTTSWVSWGLVVVLLCTLTLIPRMREPRLATRWGWFWLTLFYPIGPIAYLALSGVLMPHAPDDAHRRRLTGGWAFLLLVALGAALGGTI
jgi:hypothetical protein